MVLRLPKISARATIDIPLTNQAMGKFFSKKDGSPQLDAIRRWERENAKLSDGVSLQVVGADPVPNIVDAEIVKFSIDFVP